MPVPALSDLIALLFTAAEQAPAEPTVLSTTVEGWVAMLATVFTVELLYRAIVFIAILVIAGILGRLASRAAAAALARAPRKPSTLLVTFIVIWVRRTILIVGLIMAIQNAGVEITPLIAGLSIGGIVFGLAVQGTLSNFISGVMLMIYQPFDVNDVIETKGIIGSVFAMTMINTVLNTPDNRQVIIPNNDIWGTTIINITRNPNRRVDLMASVAYGADLDQTIALIRELLANNPRVLKDPAPIVEVFKWGDSSIDLVVRPWTETKNYWLVHFEVSRTMKQLLDKNGIEIPFPQRTLHLAPATVEALAAALRK